MEAAAVFVDSLEHATLWRAFALLDLFGALQVCAQFRKTGQSPRRSIEGALHCFLWHFGGLTVSALLLGQPPLWIRDGAALPAFLAAWYCVFFFPKDGVFRLMQGSLGWAVVVVLAAIDSAHKVTSWGVDAAVHADHVAPRSSPSAAVLCGAISMSGGSVIHYWLSNGAAPRGGVALPGAARRYITQSLFLSTAYYVARNPHGLLPYQGLAKSTGVLLAAAFIVVLKLLAHVEVRAMTSPTVVRRGRPSMAAAAAAHSAGSRSDAAMSPCVTSEDEAAPLSRGSGASAARTPSCVAAALTAASAAASVAASTITSLPRSAGFGSAAPLATLSTPEADALAASEGETEQSEPEPANLSHRFDAVAGVGARLNGGSSERRRRRSDGESAGGSGGNGSGSNGSFGSRAGGLAEAAVVAAEEGDEVAELPSPVLNLRQRRVPRSVTCTVRRRSSRRSASSDQQ